ncbi:hypothetical protein DF018_30040 [Burkholderia cenocepacia]|nr:hypothetical protein DF018_30040 [Burkholderia cenocepacia]
MARTAEYSIKGYLYQFLRYLSEILVAEEGTKITIEGAIEDIDVVTPTLTTAVQCKYHEQADKFTLGKIYKPILLMLEHFSKNAAQVPTVYYRLFCYFPEEGGTRSLTRTELDTVLATTSEPLKVIAGRIAAGVDLDAFLGRFKIEFGQSTDALQQSVVASLKAKGFSAEDVEAIIYPTAIQRIVDLATQGAVTDRTIEPSVFLQGLRRVRQVTFTRWTRELATRAQIFQRLRKDLKLSLGHNSRARHFVIDPGAIAHFDDDVVRFIKKFVERYSCKYLHDNPPLFAITGQYDVGALQARLHDAGLRCADGLVGGVEFRASELFRRPLRRRTPFAIEFSLRLAKRAVMTESGMTRPDELFLVNVEDDAWVHHDVNVHRFEIERLSDLEYVLQLRDSYV